MSEQDRTVQRIVAWAETQDADVRAASKLLAAQGHWLRKAHFLKRCVSEESGTLWIDWWTVEELLDGGEFSTASSGEKALLRFAVMLARDTFSLSSLDSTNRGLAVQALMDALRVRR